MALGAAHHVVAGGRIIRSPSTWCGRGRIVLFLVFLDLCRLVGDRGRLGISRWLVEFGHFHGFNRLGLQLDG